MTRHQRKLAQKQEREAQTKKSQPSRIRPGHVVLVVIIVGVAVGVVYGLRRLAATTPPATYTAAPVHWHAKIDLEVCGEKRDLPGPQDGKMVGGHLYHHHGDNTWHIEGRIISQDDIKLGRFFDEHEIAFDRDQLMEKKNGDECAPGKPGQVKMFANGSPSEAFRDYIPLGKENAVDDIVRIVFE